MLSAGRNYAMNLLSQREHSKFELRKKLIIKGFTDNEITEVLKNLEEQGLQSDLRFVESYVSMRCKRNFGPMRINVELRERGIDQDLGEKILSKYDSSWNELAEKARCKKFGNEIPKDLSDRTKQIRYLYYKGFDAATIRKIF